MGVSQANVAMMFINVSTKQTEWSRENINHKYTMYKLVDANADLMLI